MTGLFLDNNQSNALDDMQDRWDGKWLAAIV